MEDATPADPAISGRVDKPLGQNAVDNDRRLVTPAR
jgi:hypothetical protein